MFSFAKSSFMFFECSAHIDGERFLSVGCILQSFIKLIWKHVFFYLEQKLN